MIVVSSIWEIYCKQIKDFSSPKSTYIALPDLHLVIVCFGCGHRFTTRLAKYMKYENEMKYENIQVVYPPAVEKPHYDSSNSPR